MRGFADRALILLSNCDDYEGSGAIYKYDYKLAIANLVNYLKSQGVSHDCLITDSLATRLPMHAPTWLATGAPEDIFFMQNYCSVPKYQLQALPEEIISALRTKLPIERGLSASERFAIVAKRVKYAEKALIDRYRFVAVFGKEFKVKSKEGDGKAILRVNERKFYTSMELGGNPVEINGFLQRPYTNQCISEWGKYDGWE